jgi:hypothetical protein
MTICHATGSETNPFVSITVAMPAVQAHDRHQNDEDIIGATGECPGGASVEGTKAVAGVFAETFAPLLAAIAGEPATTPAAAPGETAVNPADEVGRQGVKEAFQSEAPTHMAAANPSGSQQDRAGPSSGSLPVTGLAALLLALLGMTGLALGIRARRATAAAG